MELQYKIFIKHSITFLCSFLLLVTSVSCKDEKQDSNAISETRKGALFTILSPEETHISFKNELTETVFKNGLFYEYYYNGAGVAVGDLNADGLCDVYFLSNLKTNKLYLNQGNMVFEERTKEANLEGHYGFPTGVTMVDINADGRLDIYICKSGKIDDPNLRRNELYVNLGNNSEGIPIFEEQAKQYGLDLPHFSTQASFFDYDKDGDLDMFLINHGIEIYPDDAIEKSLNVASKYRGERLYRNDGGVFMDVTQEAHIINNLIGFGLGVAIGDLNNDGWPDILVGNDFSEKDHMYLNQKDGTFKEIINMATGHISNFSMGNDIADINNDGLVDFISVDMMSEHNFDIKTSMSGMNPERFYKHVNLGLHHQYMYNTLQLNGGVHKGLPRFSDIAQLAGVSSTDWSWAPLFFDMDNDGLKDIFISNGIKRDFRNNDFVNYRKEQQQKLVELKEAGQNIDLKAYVKDIMDHMPQRKKENCFYKNKGDLTFEAIELEVRDRILTSSNGAAYADFDNDGDMDIVVNNSDDFSFIYRNNASENKRGYFLDVKLKGSSMNPYGVGAKLILKQKGREQILEQYLTRGFQSSVSEVLHFGLGSRDEIEALKIIWPDGKQEVLYDFKGNQVITLNHENAKETHSVIEVDSSFFKDVTSLTKLNHRHIENKFDDFEQESLLPHKMSNFGPALAVGDVNRDGKDDFYVGGAKDFSGGLYLQTTEGTFKETNNKLWLLDKTSEDIGAELFDVDSDGDLDLYVVSGGNEYNDDSRALQDRLYLNNGFGHFTKALGALPKMITSGSVVKPCDFDNDGDLDVFVGGRLVPGKYPFPARSYLLRNDFKNGEVSFTDVTDEMLPELKEMGLITDAEWVDVTGDKTKDLIVVGEWTPVNVFKNQGDMFLDITVKTGLKDKTGWWFSLASADMDNDGDMDLVLGNLGKNYKYKASYEEPFGVHTADFDDNGSLDIVLSYYDMGKKYPLRGRSCSSQQMPFIKKKFPTYNAFGQATLKDIYGETLEQSLSYRANTFATSYVENLGEGVFKMVELPNEVQFSSVNDMLLEDVNDDGKRDIITIGNLYASEIETPRNDASHGLVLLGDGKGGFTTVASNKSGLFIDGDSKHIKKIKINGHENTFLIAKNNDLMQIVTLK
ncbi:VCBS repeat-containing protein [Aestuariivivens marinum]|uniref:VCBS repeat-containing protein n=1 Tax=Aestuariivivens marinum TaxID=2913555 RepID=UPI001F58E216|nr:VCBS repeat-containing protein [Aestuariivivens marinum]